MASESIIFTALYSPPIPTPAPKPEPVAVDSKKEELTPNQQRVVQNCIEQMRGIRGTLSLLPEGKNFSPSLAAAFKSSDVYAGCAIAELRSMFHEYTGEN